MYKHVLITVGNCEDMLSRNFGSNQVRRYFRESPHSLIKGLVLRAEVEGGSFRVLTNSVINALRARIPESGNRILERVVEELYYFARRNPVLFFIAKEVQIEKKAAE